MKVLKFGGTSVGSAQRMKDVAKLITGDRKDRCIVSHVGYNQLVSRDFRLPVQKEPRRSE